MVDEEAVKKMLRAVLQSRSAISLSRLQAEYKELTGETIPHKQLGHTTVDALLHSMPSVVHLDRTRSGEVMCYATVGNEKANITKLVARQHAAKKTGRPQVVNCQMRVKPTSPLVLNAKPRTSLRQPEYRGRQGRGSGRTGSMRETQPDGRGGRVHNTPPNTPTRRGSLTSDRYDRSDKRMTLPSRFQKEVHTHLSRNPQHSHAPSNLNESTPPSKPRTQLSLYSPKLVQSRLKEVLSKHSNGFWVSKLPQIYRELYKQELPSEALKDLEQWTHICTVEKPCSSKSQELLLYPAKDVSQTTNTYSLEMTHISDKQFPSPPKPQKVSRKPKNNTSSPLACPKALPEDIKQNLAELLLKYSSGLWAHALPKLYQDTYKTNLPEYVLDNLPLLSDICTIDHPVPDNPKRAILYVKVLEDENCNRTDLADLKAREEAGRRLSSQSVPPLLIPREEYPSVLVVEASSTNSVVLRYIGEEYSKAQEKLEDDMKEFYRQDNTRKTLISLSSGQLTAVIAEEEEEILRAQVCEVKTDKVKVYYVDHGFSDVISKSKLLELHEKFFKLPFQATKCKLAGLEAFALEPAVLKKFDSMASGKILLAEILEREDIPLMVLYDTSQEDDININACCLKALQEKSLENPLQTNSAYMNVSVTSVCSDGIFYCQLPSRGLTKLSEILEKTESYFHSQKSKGSMGSSLLLDCFFEEVTSESLVSRPFCGKNCLARYKGKWSRVEITNLHGSRVLDILFVDVGVQASVEAIELREIPHPFLRDLITIPPQAVKCCLADLPVSVGCWTPDAVQWLRDTALHCSDCSLKIVKVEESKRLAHVYLFTNKNFHDPSHSLNRQLANSDLWKHQDDVFLSSQGSLKSPIQTISSDTPPTASTPTPATGTSSPSTNRAGRAPHPPKRLAPHLDSCSTLSGSLTLPPVLELPQTGQNMDIYVSVACHPGHFVLQPWQEMYKLVVLMEEMILYYNKTDEKPLTVEKNQVYAAKVENNWHRVLVKGVLSNGLVSVYELDYGKHELVSCSVLRTLIQEFRQLPFQGITAQLAGVKSRQWSEEASIVFRNHVEKKPMVAQVESVQEAEQPWDRKLTVYLVDTSQEDSDIWVHDLMAEFTDELTKAA
ncbi:tudor domain-containing protein 7B isoform X1 [Pangasianodon hypophthalmus]|uniref:tudor domain-containing protein 7B isoform X1 n=3 Tax=Pangasianodon hypophthalmus TaxID=310915 RepID=UPI0023078B5D|nr:tudor domain-containing protein 7B isoform X1 [Pangasianodon hypophthalmus]